MHQIISTKLQDCIGVDLYSNSINTGTISAKVQDCIGVTYTATQSTLELFKLEVDYIINFISPKLQDCIGVTYTATQSILGLFKLEVNYSSNCFSKSARLHRSYLYSNSVNTGTI